MKLREINGKKIVDAKSPVILHILPEDVKKGHRKAPDCCAAAQACMRQLHVPHALVHLSRVYVEKPKHWVRYMTPERLRTEIVSFDRGHRFEEGDYKLGVCESSSKGRQKGTHPKKGRPGVKVPQRGRKSKYISVRGVRVTAGASPKVYAAVA